MHFTRLTSLRHYVSSSPFPMFLPLHAQNEDITEMKGKRKRERVKEIYDVNAGPMWVREKGFEVRLSKLGAETEIWQERGTKPNLL